jgi:hypothetical protein
MLLDGRLAGPGAELFDVGSDADCLDIRELKPALSHQSKNCFTARAYAMRVLRLRMLVVRNSMNRAGSGVPPILI